MIEDINVVGWRDAIRDISALNYRRTKNDRFEAFCSDRGRMVYLGKYDTPEEAENVAYNYRVNRLIARTEEYGLNVDDGVMFMQNYIAFDNGMIFNLHGNLMHAHTNRDGYPQCLFNGKNLQIHRIIASIFCRRELGKDFVNHIDGNKQNNEARNLEWCTRSENTLHAYRTGLQTNVGGIPVYSVEEKRYIKEHRFDNYRDIANVLNRNPETVRKYMEKYRREFKDD